MKIIHCINDKRLGLRKPFRYFNIDDYQGIDLTDTTIITFSKVLAKDSVEKVVVNGVKRILLEKTKNVFLHNIQCESPFYAQIFWDTTHRLEVGGYLYLEEALVIEDFTAKKYYKDSFILEQVINKNIYRYKKTTPLIIEKDRGLEAWSFCLPVGGDDPTFLNQCVERILNIEIPYKEILLCGKVHPDFKYKDKVKIIDDEGDGKLNHLTKKKNILVSSASFNNICILHDRVLLPINFYSAINDFGDDYPLTGFQSFYFHDKYNFLPRKYSDFNTIEQDLTKEIDIENVERKDTKIISKLFYCYQHPARSSFGHDYLTGSLYLTKKSLWINYPQNENLFWNDYEDIEHGIRLSHYGIPCRINPHSVTQSMNSRSVIHYYGYVATRNISGRITMSRCMLERLPFLRRKPLFKMSKESARQNTYSFAKKYGASQHTLLQITSASMSGISRYLIISKVINDITVTLDAMEEFMMDFSKQILCESMAPNEYDDIIRVMFSSASPQTKKKALITSFILNNQLFHSFSCSPFYKSHDDWFIEKGFFSRLGNIISAINLKYIIPGVYFPYSLRQVYKNLRDTTLWK